MVDHVDICCCVLIMLVVRTPAEVSHAHAALPIVCLCVCLPFHVIFSRRLPVHVSLLLCQSLCYLAQLPKLASTGSQIIGRQLR